MKMNIEQLSTKRELISKANRTVVLAVSLAVFVTIFSLIAVKTLASQGAYQGRVISAKEDAVKQLKQDLKVVDTLKKSYQDFLGESQNIIGGTVTGTTPKDGNNAKIILDALPSYYDFPALTTSLETLLVGQGVKITSIGGTDEEVTQSGNRSSSNPEPIPVPFQLTASGDYDRIKSVSDAFERSIRPMHVKTMNITGNQQALSLTLTAETYFQPAKSLNIKTKVVK